MTSVADLAAPPTWSTWVPVVSALAGGLMAIISGWVGAWLTRRREDRARLFQQRREVCVGAIGAYRDYTIALADAETVTFLAGEFRRSRNSYDRLIKQIEAGEVKELPPFLREVIPADADLLERVQEIADEVAEYRKTYSKTIIEKKEAVHVARRHMAYWTGMIEFTCAPKVSQAYEALRQVDMMDVVKQPAALSHFMAVAKVDMRQEPASWWSTCWEKNDA